MIDPYAPPGASASQAPPGAAPVRDPASAVVTVALSLVALGSGHVYVGRARRGLAWYGAVCGAGLGFAALAPLVFRGIGIAGLFLFGLAPVGLGVAAIVDAGRLARARARRVDAGILVASVVGFLVGGVVLRVVMRTYLLEAFKIPSGSTLPTVAIGDHLFVDKKAGGTARRGELIVFPFPEHPDQSFIKRVIGLPGDTVEVDHGRVTINGWLVPRCPLGEWSYSDEAMHQGEVWLEYLGDASYLVFEDAAGFGFPGSKWKVAAGQVFVMGDNRENSHDSRTWYGGAGGGVPIATVGGTVFTVWLASTEKGIDWAREGLDLGGRHPGAPPGAPAMAPAVEECMRRRPAGAVGP
jgi:signal peptidase I